MENALKTLFDAIKKIDKTILNESMQSKIEDEFNKAVSKKVSEIATNLDESIKVAVVASTKDLKSKFDNAVTSKANRLVNRQTKKLNEALNRKTKRLADKMDIYLNMAVRDIKSDVKASKLNESKAKKVDVVEKMLKTLGVEISNNSESKRAKKYERQLFESQTQMKRLQDETLKLKKEMVISQVSDSMGIMERQTFKNLCESLHLKSTSFKDVKAFRQQLMTLKRSLNESTSKRHHSPKREPKIPSKPKRSWE